MSVSTPNGIDLRPLTHSLIAAVLLAFAVLSLALSTGNWDRFANGIHDFMPLYINSRLIGSHQLYDAEAAFREQHRIMGAYLPMCVNDRFPWQALLWYPLGCLPYPAAYWIYLAIQFACFGALVRIWLLPRDCVVWGLLYWPLWLSIIIGQDVVILLVLFAGAIRCLEARRDILAGILLALCTAKPQLFVLIPIVLLAEHRWTAIRSAVAGVLVLHAAGTVAAGVDWPIRWWHTLTALRAELNHYGYLDAHNPSLFQFGVSPGTIGLALLSGGVFGYWIWRCRSLQMKFAIAVIGGIFLSPHAAPADLPILLVGLTAVPFSGVGRWLRVALLTPLPYWALAHSQPWNLLMPALLFAIGAALGANALRSKHRPGLPDPAVPTCSAKSSA